MTLYTRTHTLTNPSTHPRTLLLTFDAFGTLFHPHPPVQDQYASTAHEFGLSRTAITPDKLKTAFKEVFRAHLKKYPNYGRADVLRGRYGGPRQWWEEVIRGSFGRVLDDTGRESSSPSSPSSPSTQQVPGDGRQTVLPDGMIEALLNRFSGAEGYALYDDVAPFLARMRQLRASSPARRFDRVFLGVVSNSDDRVPSVLKALGVRVGDMRADQDLSSMELPGFEERRVQRQQHRRESGSTSSDTRLGGQSDDADADIDLIITSYEAGEEKPNRLIFDVARRQAGLLARERSHTHGSAPVGADDPDEWVCVHVGDDYEKDYLAAMDAGWRSYLLPRGQAPDRPAETISSLVELVDKLKIGS